MHCKQLWNGKSQLKANLLPRIAQQEVMYLLLLPAAPRLKSATDILPLNWLMAFGAEFNSTSVFTDIIDYCFVSSISSTNAHSCASCGGVPDPRHCRYSSYDKNFLSDLPAPEGGGASLRRQRISLPRLARRAPPGGVFGCHFHPACCMGSRASRDALQVVLDGLQERHRAAGPSGRWSDDAATYSSCPGSVINLNPTYPGYRD